MTYEEQGRVGGVCYILLRTSTPAVSPRPRPRKPRTIDGLVGSWGPVVGRPTCRRYCGSCSPVRREKQELQVIVDLVTFDHIRNNPNEDIPGGHPISQALDKGYRILYFGRPGCELRP
ncbi:hypothetical protein J6590_048975 [Homalodisca vitripennis]|nr:hypothetical protein J6590_048975 [Homalodisca vitripennis]